MTFPKMDDDLPAYVAELTARGLDARVGTVSGPNGYRSESRLDPTFFRSGNSITHKTERCGSILTLMVFARAAGQSGPLQVQPKHPNLARSV
jgi:hypothetical protein